MSEVIETRYGMMTLYHSMEELDGMSYQDAVDWLSFNDRNGRYSIDDQLAENGEVASIEVMKAEILEQSKC